MTAGDPLGVAEGATMTAAGGMVEAAMVGASEAAMVEGVVPGRAVASGELSSPGLCCFFRRWCEALASHLLHNTGCPHGFCKFVTECMWVPLCWEHFCF